MSRTVHAAPLPQTAVDLLRRADGELLAAQFSAAPDETFTHAHLAALRAAAAVLAVRGRPTGRRAPRTVWDMLAAVAPEAADWSTYFAAGAPVRRAIDAGRFDAVDADAELLAAQLSSAPDETFTHAHLAALRAAAAVLAVRGRPTGRRARPSGPARRPSAACTRTRAGWGRRGPGASSARRSPAASRRPGRPGSAGSPPCRSRSPPGRPAARRVLWVGGGMLRVAASTRCHRSVPPDHRRPSRPTC